MASFQQVISSYPCSQLFLDHGSGEGCNKSFSSSIGVPLRARLSLQCYCQKLEGVSSLDQKKTTRESLWQELFMDPSLWWDHRAEKVNPRYPDFKHKIKKQSLWLNDLTPQWVEAKLGAMAPGTIQENVFSWNKRMERCFKAGHYEETIELFQQMEQEGLNPDKFTFIPALNACSKLGALKHGEYIHEQIIRINLDTDLYVSTCLVNMYAKCGSIEDAQRVFNKMPTRDVVAWSAMIQGYVKCGEGRKALELFLHMQDEEQVDPDPIIYAVVLNACASIAALEEGKRVHEEIIVRGYENDLVVGSCLVDMYSKCGTMEDAQRVFNKMPTRNVVTWSAMIHGYVKCGEGKKALELFQRMQNEKGLDPNPITFVGVLNACASIAALEEGKRVHEQIIEKGYEDDVFVGNCLVDMYAKCGSIHDALRVFEKMPTRDVVAWNAMIAGCGMHGYARDALEHFELMSQVVDVDDVTFTSLLCACSCGGLVDEGMLYFESMRAIYNISPTLEHYACVVDLLCRAGFLHEAHELTRSMPCEPNVWVWMSILGGCRTHQNVAMGELAAKRVFELDSQNVAAYVVLSKIYASVAISDGNTRVLSKVGKGLHKFVANDSKYSQLH